MLDPSKVSACLVSRGDVDMTEIIESLTAAGIGEILCWDNSKREDKKTSGRYFMVEEASNDVVFFVDDDFVISDPGAVIAAYEPGVLTANMSEGWRAGHDYHDLALVGMGAVCDAWLPLDAIYRYQKHFCFDDLFHYWADFAVGVLTPWKLVDVPARVLPWGYAPNRMNAQPWFKKGKAKMIERARAIRDDAA